MYIARFSYKVLPAESAGEPSISFGRRIKAANRRFGRTRLLAAYRGPWTPGSAV